MLYLITNRQLVEKHAYIRVIQEAIKGGLDAIILREKDLESKELHPLALEIKKEIEGTETLLIINRDQGVAEDIGAHGLHLGFKDILSKDITFDGLLGVSIHTLEEGIVAQERGASYLLASHVFPTKCKEGVEPKGIDFIKELKSRVQIPVIALGGIKEENMEEILEVSPDGIAVMSEIMQAEDPCSKAQTLKKMMKQYKK